MALEIELKFYSFDFEEIRSKLRKHGAEFKSCFFEENIVFDTPTRTLRSSGTLLRLRRAGKNVLCLKKSLHNVDAEVKTRREIETGIESFEQMHTILEILGYEAVLTYEKVREKWQMGECLVCLDELPFARFVEIEGLQKQIFSCANSLGLKKEDSTTKSYHDLNREYRRQNSLAPNDSFVFTEPLRSRLMHNLQEDNF